MGEPPIVFTFSSTLMCLFFFLSGKEYKSSFRTAEDGCALEGGSSGPLGMKHKHSRVRKPRNITSFIIIRSAVGGEHDYTVEYPQVN